ncbi:ABC transporter ATP-binding protein/permease [Ramlibacter solisilvae]|uniref:ABC transporter n=1 Tax=Ramlibacter tataouinensis TaxID=94132 RepID=A0A127JRE5_9BURK|nr:SbmA/BacA-like family transporter [Ramlibacter tataouinensis]AMO22594.1 ABC transporter [Ramlibacter tataouinensis]
MDESDGFLLNRQSWLRWREMVSSFARSPEAGSRAKRLFVALLALLLAINGLNVLNSYVGRDFMTAIERRSMPVFLTMATIYVAVFAVSTVAAVVYRYTEEHLALLWRGWLTRRLVGEYLEEGTYYWLRESGIENPDQRIADDVRAFTATTISLMLVLLNTTFTTLAFSSVMWSISPLLFGVAVAYAALGSCLTVLFGRSLLWLNYRQADREAHLRADLVHLRQNAESVAMLRREGRIGALLRRRVDDLVSNAERIIGVNRNLGFFTTGYNYLIQIIPVLIVAPLFIRGEAAFGVITQSAMAFSHLIGAFSLVITQFQQISGYAVVLARLSALQDGAEQAAAPRPSGIEIREDGMQLAWQALSLRSRHDDATVLRSLTFTVPPGTHVLVMGPNEAARVALFRASASLWRAGEGRIVRPAPGAILFLPERTYLPPGTLREALLRTQQEHEADEAQIGAVLSAVGVEDAVSRAGGLEVQHDWDDVFSLADQERLSFARVLLATPRFAVLDRPSKLLGVDETARLIRLLATRSITVVTFESDEALSTCHDQCLTLEAGATWSAHSVHRETYTA